MGGELLIEEIEAIPKEYKNLFFESGTYKGDTAVLAAKYFKNVTTVEISESLFNEAKERLEQYKNIQHIFGDTVEELEKLYDVYKDGGVFFLDGHISGHDSSHCSKYPVPLLEELKILNSRALGPSLIIIDDVRLWHFGHWDKVDKESILRSFRPSSVKCAYVKNDRFWIYTR